MNNTELYINGRLVDTGGDLGVRLNRKLIDPGALNTVDAQFSYSISLPRSQVNVEAFNYATVEETRNKFNRVYNAELVVNSVRVFGPGLFRLTSITADGIKGQLYLPAKKTIKDIFGELKLTQNAPYELPFLDFAEYVNLYNNAAAEAPQAAIFPYILYGVLPKVPINKDANTYSARNLWDASVRLGISDLAPAINPLIMLRHIFNVNGYTLQGTAFQDEKLTKLYQSYKNAPDYVQPWNYGRHANMKLHGAWSSRNNKRTGALNDLERGGGQASDQTGGLFTCDLFDATNTQIVVDIDSGGNILYKETNDNSGKTWVNCQVRIPLSGFYKVQFNASISMDQAENWRATDPATGIQHVGGRTSNARNDFNSNAYGMRLVRDRGAGDTGVLGAKLDGTFYYDNQPQNQTFDGNNIPKYFPQLDDNGQINFIDAAQDNNIVVGFEFGRNEDGSGLYVNPRDSSNKLAQVMAAKPALSWSVADASDKPTKLAIKSPGYWKYGRIGDFDNEGDNPNINLDYSAGPRVNGKILDANGNPADAPNSNVNDRIAGYYISQLTGFQTPSADWRVTDFIELAVLVSPAFSATYSGDDVDLMAGQALAVGYYINGSGEVLPYADSSVSYTPNLIPVLPNTSYDITFTPVGGGVFFYDSAGNFISFYNSGGKFVTPLNAYGIKINLFTNEYNVRTLKSASVASSTAVLSFYDANLQFIGSAINAPGAGITENYVNEPIVAPSGARYFRMSEQVGNALTITGTSIYAANVILNRFQLARFYTYRITAPAGYTGFAYVHNGADVSPLSIVPFVNGVAEFDTTYAPILVLDPKLTLYLRTPAFNVDGSLVISRQIADDSQDVIDWELTDKYKIDLTSAPVNFAKRGQYANTAQNADWFAQGSANAIVWLEAGEILSIASVSSEGRYRRDGMHSTFGWASHEILFDLTIEPFRTDPEWLKVDLRGNGTAPMDWNDLSNFSRDTIDLVQFLDAEMKTDDYIDNFCKAWNLGLSQIDADTFSLDIKQSKSATSSISVDLDGIASITERENAPLGLPSQYVLGFTIDTEEEGYVETIDETITDPIKRLKSGETGGGTFDTGATEESVVTQTSTFSYNWYKAITKVEAGGNITISLPIISKAEAWAPTLSYAEAMTKRYTDLAQRFMYYDGILDGTYQYNGASLQIASVRNDIPGRSILNYKNELYTILYNYFTLLISGASEYTNIEALLSAPQYVQLDGSRSVKFNGDLYFIAEISGYDPYNRNKSKIKLIRKL